MEAEGRLWWDAGVLRGVKGRRGHSLGERGCPRPERSPGRARGLEAQAPIASPGSYMGPGPARPALGSPHVNALWGHLGQEAADFFTEKGVRALGGLRSRRSRLPSWVV